MNTDRTRAKLRAVEHNVIGQRANSARIRLKLVHVMLMWRSKWMVRRVPALVRLVILKHGEVSDPGKVVSALAESHVPVSIFTRQLNAKCAGSLEHAVVRTQPGFFRLQRPADKHKQIIGFGASHLAQL